MQNLSPRKYFQVYSIGLLNKIGSCMEVFKSGIFFSNHCRTKIRLLNKGSIQHPSECNKVVKLHYLKLMQEHISYLLLNHHGKASWPVTASLLKLTQPFS